MPTIHTGNARMVMGLGYKKGKEEKRRYNTALEMQKDDIKSSKSASNYSSAMSAYKAYQDLKARREEKKKLLKDSDKDGLGEYTADQISSSSVGSSAKLKNDYEHPSDEANAEAYKNSLFDSKRKYAESKLKYKVK